mgnify:CR=1 FL=1
MAKDFGFSAIALTDHLNIHGWPDFEKACKKNQIKPIYGVEGALINQLLRCGTSVGVNVHEAQYAQGTKDFISKFEIALKECNESEYWLELLFETNCMKKEEYKVLQNECGSIRRMLISSLKTIKSKE